MRCAAPALLPGSRRRDHERRPERTHDPSCAWSRAYKCGVAVTAAQRGVAGADCDRVNLLRESPAFRRLWLSRFVSFVGDSLALVALILYVAEHTNEGFAVAALLLAGDFAPTLLAPWTGALADRVDMRRLMITCEVLQAVAVLAMAVSLDSLAVVFVLVVARSVLASTIGPAARSGVSRIVDDADLEARTRCWASGPLASKRSARRWPPRWFRSSGRGARCWSTRPRSWLSALVLFGLPALPPIRDDVLDSGPGHLVASRRPRRRARVVHGSTRAHHRDRLRQRSWSSSGWTMSRSCSSVANVLHSGSTGTALLYAGSGVGLVHRVPRR